MPTSHQYLEERQAAHLKFADALARSKVRTEVDFEAALVSYRERFRTEAVNLALDGLAGYEHQLYVAER
jgi:hypothetical protein